MSDLSWGWLELAQLLLAVVMGTLIGLQRQLHHKPAGATTLALVTLASTLTMQLSLRLPASGGMTGGDPGRLAAAIITGIGFLGAGVIIRSGVHVQGVTTAATVWLMACLGLGLGAGYLVPSLTAYGLVWLIFLIDPLTNQLANRSNRRG